MSEQAHIFELKVYPENHYNANSKIPCNSADIIPLLEKRFDKYKWAWILHDKDLKEDGTPCKPHIQFLVNAVGTTVSLDKIRRDYSISYSNVYAKEDWIESVKYLLHRSRKSIGDSNKYKYPLSDLHYNFNIDYIFEGKIGEALDECDVLVHLVEKYLDNPSWSYLDLAKYSGSIGQFGFYKKNFYTIERHINDEIKRSNRLCNLRHGNYPYD